jgi:protein-disulfide isomerase
MKRLLHSRTALFVGVAVVAIVVAGALIGFSLSSGSKAEPATSPVLPVTTTNGSTGATGTTVEPKVTGAAATAGLFRGIPQHLNQLGNPNAKVTLIEFADPQCPFCRQFALDALPALVKEYIRTGKVKLVVFGIEAIGPNSVDGLRAIYAAGLQGKLWNVLDLLYRNQGAENSGWITDDLLRRVGNSVPGLDTGRMMADRQSSDVDGALAASAQQATNARVRATPTFFAGRTGGTLQQLPITALTPDAFRPALNSLLG